MTILTVRFSVIFYEEYIYADRLFRVQKKIQSNIIFYGDDIIYNDQYSIRGREYEFLGKRLFYHNGEMYSVESRTLKKEDRYILYDIHEIESMDNIVLVRREKESVFYDTYFARMSVFHENYDLIAFNRRHYLIYYDGRLTLRQLNGTVVFEKSIPSILKIGIHGEEVFYKTDLVHILNYKTMEKVDYTREYSLNLGSEEFIEDFLRANKMEYERAEKIYFKLTDFFITDDLYLIYYNDVYRRDKPLYQSMYKNIPTNNILLSLHNDIQIIIFENNLYFNAYRIKKLAIKYNQIFIGNLLFENFDLHEDYRTYKVDSQRLYIYMKNELEAFFDFAIHYIYIYNDVIYIYTGENSILKINKAVETIEKNVKLTNIINDNGRILFYSFNEPIGKNVFEDIRKLAYERGEELVFTVEKTEELRKGAEKFREKTEEIRKKYEE